MQTSFLICLIKSPELFFLHLTFPKPVSLFIGHFNCSNPFLSIAYFLKNTIFANIGNRIKKTMLFLRLLTIKMLYITNL